MKITHTNHFMRAAAALALLTATAGYTQQASPAAPPANSAGQKNANHIIDLRQGLSTRPYSPLLPEPSYPSTPRRDEQFTVEYVYRYAESDYTPEVVVKTVPKAAARQDTPEHAFIALISATSALDYDWWLSLWDKKSQEMILAEGKQRGQDAAYWRSVWQRTNGPASTLVKRLETPANVILEYREGQREPGKPEGLFPAVFKLQDGKWLLTRELSDSLFFPYSLQGGNSFAISTFLVPSVAFSGQHTPFQQIQDLYLRNQPAGLDTATRTIW